MTQIEIIQTLEFTKLELETCYKRLGYTSSNILKSLDETIEAAELLQQSNLDRIKELEGEVKHLNHHIDDTLMVIINNNSQDLNALHKTVANRDLRIKELEEQLRDCNMNSMGMEL